MTPVEQRVRAAVRRKVLQGVYTSDYRISEVTIATELNVSRTPARAALIALEAEGLIEKRTGRGYTAKQISPDDISKAIQVKATLEGLAARFLASSPMSPETLEKLEHSLDLTAKVANAPRISETDVDAYVEANRLFHETIMYDCNNEFIRASYERLQHLPMLSLGAFAFDPTQLERERMRLTVGHAQHVIIFDAIKSGDLARSEANMREHGNALVNYANLFLQNPGAATPAPHKNII
jgi:GntR family transcriptional regulator of vanillate catabolism